MAARKKESTQINLLKQEGFDLTTRGRILAWILSTFRIIVIVTEIIVMVAFLSRFWLDAQNSDLNDEIKQKQAVLSASMDFENEFKDVQSRLRVFSEMTKDEGKMSGAVDAITRSLPSDIFLETILFRDGSIDLEGISPSEQSVQQLLVNLNAQPNFSDVAIGEVKTSEETGNLIFELRGDLR